MTDHIVFNEIGEADINLANKYYEDPRDIIAKVLLIKFLSCVVVMQYYLLFTD